LAGKKEVFQGGAFFLSNCEKKKAQKSRKSISFPKNETQNGEIPLHCIVRFLMAVVLVM
jgi:hypothetical protein